MEESKLKLGKNLDIEVFRGGKSRKLKAYCKDTVLDFKLKHFGNEVEQNKRITLLFHGKALLNDEIIGDIGMKDNDQLDCKVSDMKKKDLATSREDVVKVAAYFETTSASCIALLTITGVALASTWYLLFVFPEFFTAMSLVILTALSLLHMITLVIFAKEPVSH